MIINPHYRDEMLRNAQSDGGDIELFERINRGIIMGRIVTPSYQQTQAILAGGTNFCPNSDFAWSHMAATLAGITPITAGDTNYEIYRVWRQVKDANIGTTRVRSDGHGSWAAEEAVNTYLPFWDRVQGNVHLGWDGGAGDNYDIAFEMTNNWLQNNRFRYVRVAVATNGTTALPTGAKLYAGFWAKYTGGSEGWVDGNGFTISYRRNAPVGTRQLEYMVVAKTSSGHSMKSAVLSVPDAPAVLDTNNYIEITFTDASGFTEFLTYRRDVTTGQVDLVDRQLNSAQLWAYDVGQSVRVETGGFPVADITDHRAYAETLIDAVDYAQQLTFHDMRVRVPATFDTSNVVAIYLRIGVKEAITENRQIILDTVWESDSFNVWSPSAFDVYPSPRSTTLATAPPSGGSNPTDQPPIGGGRSCLWEGHEIQLSNGTWCELRDLAEGAALHSGKPSEPNTIRHFLDGEVSQWFVLEFSNGVVLMATAVHRFGRSLDDGSGVQVANMKIGDVILGGDTRRGDYEVTLVDKMLMTKTESDRFLRVRSPQHTADSPNKLHRVGTKLTGIYVYSHNNKPVATGD
jgi:hypothetical protein